MLMFTVRHETHVTGSHIGLPHAKKNYKAVTRGRTDHFSSILADPGTGRMVSDLENFLPAVSF